MSKKISFVLLSILISCVILFYNFSSNKVIATGNTYYVDATSGDDLNGGLSEADAWQTLTKVNSAMGDTTITAGDTILFKKGETFVGNLIVGVSGAVGNILTFGAYGSGYKPIIDATGLLHGIDIRTGLSYITIEDITVSNATNEGIFLYDSVSNVIANNINVNNSTEGFHITTGNFSNIQINNANTSSVVYGFYASNFTSLTGLTVDNSVFNNSVTGYGFFIDNIAAGSVSDISLQKSVADGNHIDGFKVNNSDGGSCSNIDLSDIEAKNNVGRGIYIFACDNLDILRADTSSNGPYGTDIMSTTDGVRISNLNSSNNRVGGFHMDTSEGPMQNITFIDSQLNSNGGNGFALRGAGENMEIYNVDASNNLGDGFNVHFDWSEVYIDHCRADNNGDVDDAASGDGYSFHEDSSGSITNSTAHNNLKSAVANIGNSDVDLKNNIFSHDTNGTLALVFLGDAASADIYNNDLYSGSHIGDGLRLGEDGDTVNTVVKNNIIYGFERGIYLVGGNAVDDYNDVYGASISDYAGISKGEHSISSDPFFVDAGSLNFNLQQKSPCVDSGTSEAGVLTIDYLSVLRYDDPFIPNTGSGTYNYYDRGAFEEYPKTNALPETGSKNEP
jgi:parallel beta-helix repeat protein